MSKQESGKDLREAFESAASCVKQEVIELAGEVEHALDDVARRLRTSAENRPSGRERKLARLGVRYLALIEAGRGTDADDDPDLSRMVAELRRESSARD